MAAFATIDDITDQFRPLTPAETHKAAALLPLVSDLLRQEAKNVGKNLDQMILSGCLLESVVKSVTVDVVSRALMNPTDDKGAMTQMQESALGYMVGGTYFTPGGGLFVKNAELARLGLRRQRIGAIDLA